MPACIICFPFLWAGLCVPFIIACDSVATSLSFKLAYVVVRNKARERDKVMYRYKFSLRGRRMV